MKTEIKQRYEAWRAQPGLDPETAAELESIRGDDAAVEDRFYRDLEFGTGGLRGVLGAGTNRMNRYTVAKATRGLAAYLKETFPSPSCAIAHDSRRGSEEFSRVAAAVLAQEGVQVYLYRELMPTPMLSFAVRHLGCSGGVVITASHNPAQYNGYKVYGADGCQITLEAAAQVLARIERQPDFGGPLPDFDNWMDRGRIRWIEQETLDAYYEAVLAQSVERPAVPLHVVYSPLNGTGNRPVRRILQQLGNIRVTVVPQQEQPDGNFPTCPYPNPEIEEAMRLAVELCRETGADFCLATDPDCDRVGAAVLDRDGSVKLINGNEMGVMLLDFVCAGRTAAGTMPRDPVAVKTIVTTEMASAVARHYGVELRNVLTGFKFIGEQIGLLEREGHPERYVFGFEESYGYLSGGYVRDKDAVNGAMLICEMAAHYKARGKSLLDVLEELSQRYGYYKSSLLSFTFEGPSGMARMNAILDRVRTGAPREYCGKPVLGITDYLRDGTGLPRSNVLALALADGCQVVMRPSGTEPKLKLYVTAVGTTAAQAEEVCAELCSGCRAFVESAC